MAQSLSPSVDPRQRHEQRDQAAFAAAADDVAAPARAFVARLAGAAERFVNVALAFRREQACERQAGQFAALIAEQLLRAAIDRLHVGVLIEHDDAVGRRIEDVADLADLRLGVAQRRLEGLLPLIAAAAAADAGQHQHQCGLAFPRRGEQPRLDRHLVALIGGDGQRLRAVVLAGVGVVRLDEQRIEAAGLFQRVQLVVAGPVEEGAVGIDQLVEPIDQHADRQPVEDRTLIGGECLRGGSLRSRLSGLRRPPFSRFLGIRWRRLFNLLRLVLGAAQARRQTVRQFAERAALDRRQRRHAFRGRGRGKRHDIHWRRHRGGRWALVAEHRRLDASCGRRVGAVRSRQFVDARDLAANAEATVAAEIAVAIEHRKPRQFDGKARVHSVDREGDGDAAPGFARGERAGDLAFGIEPQRGRHVAPRLAESGCGLRTDQRLEFVGANRETAVVVHLPDEAKRLASLRRCDRRRWQWRRDGFARRNFGWQFRCGGCNGMGCRGLARSRCCRLLRRGPVRPWPGPLRFLRGRYRCREEGHQQSRRCTGADALNQNSTVAMLALGAACRQRGGAERCCPENGEAFRAAKPGPRRWRCVQQRAVAVEQRERFVTAG